MKLRILFFLSLFCTNAWAVVWKNLDVNVELSSDKKAHVKEKHDIVFEEDDFQIVLPFYLGEQQSIEIKKIELLDMIKNKTTPILPLSTGTPPPSMYYTFSPQAVLSIDLPRGLGKSYNLSIEYDIIGALRANKNEFHLKYSWAYPKRNGVIKYFSYSLKMPTEWTALEGTPQGITRENMAIKDQFLTELHIRSTQPMVKGPQELVNLDEIYSCQLESNLAEQLVRAYLPDLPASSVKFGTTSPMSFRLHGTTDGTVNIQTVGVDTNLSFSLSDEQKTTLSEKNIAYFKGRFETEQARIKSNINKILHAILFASINFYSKKNIEAASTVHLTNSEPTAPAKNFDVTLTDESMNIIASTLKISLRTPVTIELEGIKILSSSPAALLSDSDINSIAFTFTLSACTKI